MLTDIVLFFAARCHSHRYSSAGSRVDWYCEALCCAHWCHTVTVVLLGGVRISATRYCVRYRARCRGAQRCGELRRSRSLRVAWCHRVRLIGNR